MSLICKGDGGSSGNDDDDDIAVLALESGHHTYWATLE
jgi:hypothetical protein